MTVWYIDANRGSDANTGLSPAAAWASPAKISTITGAAGDAVLLADDSDWTISAETQISIPTSWAGTEDNPVTIGKFSPSSQSPAAQLPVIRWHTKVAANQWTYDAPSNAWSYTSALMFGTFPLVRINQSWMGSTQGFGNTPPLGSVDGEYLAVGSTLYVWAPSHTNPTDYYGEVLVSGNAGCIDVSSNRKWITVRDLEFRDTSTAVKLYAFSANPVGLVLRNLRGRVVSAMVRLQPTGAAANAVLDVGHCDIEDFGVTAIQLSPGSPAMVRCDLHHNRIRDGINCDAQGAIYCQVSSTVAPTRIYANDISRLRYGARLHPGDGSGIYTDTGASNCDVFGNVIHEAYYCAQDNSGGAVRWRHNLFYDTSAGLRLGDGKPASGTPNTAHVFENNTVITGGAGQMAPSYESGRAWRCGWRSYEPTNTMPSVVVRNNVFCDVGPGGSADPAIGGPLVSPTSADYSSNAVSGYAAVAQRAAAPYDTLPAPGTITGDLRLTAAGRPLPGSPLLSGGADLGYLRDVRGQQCRRHIGAFGAAKLLPR